MIISIIVIIGFIIYEGKRKGMKYLWIPIIATLTVGVSLALPLFLLFRQMHLDKPIEVDVFNDVNSLYDQSEKKD
ncbi:hypothetical protein JCM19055_2847 [Geomicrobium sp. JCM 19055]|nr:hypothetical protein JCM19055_2847 [Geomicrobium sp. JCM 19055]